MGEEAKIAEREIYKLLAIFLCKCNMAITNIVRTCSYLLVGKWKAFYTQRRIPGPIFITNPILSSATTNTSALHYGLISRVTATSSSSTTISSSSTATSSMVRTTNSMVTEPSQWYSSDFKYIVKRALWFSLT